MVARLEFERAVMEITAQAPSGPLVATFLHRAVAVVDRRVREFITSQA